jgi:hypothetical protein
LPLGVHLKVSAEDESDPLFIELRCSHRAKHRCQMVRSPHVIIVEEGHPGCTDLCQADVASRRNALRAIMSEDAYTRVIQRSELVRRCVNRAIIDNHHTHVDVILGKRAGQSDSQKPPPIAGRNYDCDF